MSDFAVIVEAQAAELGLVIIEPQDNVLQLDIDCGSQMDQYEKQIAAVRSIYGVVETVQTVSKSGKSHIYLRLKDNLHIEERIAIQASLGSDPRRELFTLRNLREKRDYPLFLYEKPEEGARVHHLSVASLKEESERTEREFKEIFGGVPA